MGKLRRGFLYLELAEGKPVEILRTGEFVDMRGREVTIAEADLDEYVANFGAGKAGIEVPVDVDHEHKEAVGWVKQIWREGLRLLATVDWNEIGTDLVGGKIYRYISATIDLEGKFIRAITLTNWPAVSGLEPVELSEGARTFRELEAHPRERAWFNRMLAQFAEWLGVSEMADGAPGSVRIGEYLQARIHKAFTNIADELAAGGLLTVDERKQFSAAIGAALEVFAEEVGDAGERMIAVPGPDLYFYRAGERPGKEADMDKQLTAEELAELRAQVRQELEQESQQRDQTVAELRKTLRAEIEAEMTAKAAKRTELAEFAATVCGGEHGISEKPDEVIALLEKLEGEDLERAKRLLQAKVVDFGEHGSSRNGRGELKDLPAEYVAELDAGRMTVADLKQPMFEHLGDLAEYDLSKWAGK